MTVVFTYLFKLLSFFSINMCKERDQMASAHVSMFVEGTSQWATQAWCASVP